MGANPNAEVPQAAAGVRPKLPSNDRPIVFNVGLARKGEAEPFLDTSPTRFSSTSISAVMAKRKSVCERRRK